MRQPKGFVENGKEKMVCRLKRSIYGLKQSPRCWNSTLDDQLKQIGFIQSKSDPCVYVAAEGEPFIIAIYVDDILLAGKTNERLKFVKNALASKFEVKDLGKVNYFLGIRIIQNLEEGTVWIGQPSYTERILQDFGMVDAKSAKTPVNSSLKLMKAAEESVGVKPEKYQCAVGKLLYLSTRSRPDIAFAVSSVARYTAQPTEDHWKAIKQLFRYLAGTIDYGILYKKSSESVKCIGYSDADWGGDLNDQKSTSGYLFELGEGPISWCS